MLGKMLCNMTAAQNLINQFENIIRPFNLKVGDRLRLPYNLEGYTGPNLMRKNDVVSITKIVKSTESTYTLTVKNIQGGTASFTVKNDNTFDNVLINPTGNRYNPD